MINEFFNFIKILQKNVFTSEISFCFILMIYFTQIKIIIGQCNKDDIIIEGSSCFNNIIIFDNGYRAGQFTIRKDGVLLIEYSSGNKRLFYGLKSNGRGFFKNEETNKKIYIQSNILFWSEEVVKRHESRNKIVYLYDDEFQEIPYIFSVSSYKSLNELHHFDDEGNNNHKTWLNTDFFRIDWGRYFFSYQFSLLEGKNNEYYSAYIQSINGEHKSQSYSLSKFKFINNNQHELLLSKEFNDNYNCRIISSFIFDYYNILAVFFLKSNRIYSMRLHDLINLDELYIKEIYQIEINNADTGYGIFFKAIYLKDVYVAFIFFRDKDNGKTLTLMFLKVIKNNDNYEVNSIKSKEINLFYFYTYITLNEFYKIENEKLLFVSTISQPKLILLFFETYLLYEYINTRVYEFDLEGYKFALELTVDFFNDFLMFTSTIRNGNNENDLSSILLFFSYSNGTDFF